MNLSLRTSSVLTALAAVFGIAATVLLLWHPAQAAEAAQAAQGGGGGGAAQWGYLGAALATGLAALGSGYAVALVGSAAVGTLAEKPELLGRVLIFVGLAEGIAIYGVIISIMILNRLGG